jgi:DNA polymerase-3 subunit chi
LSGDSIKNEPCQVDFYLLGQSSPETTKFACDLALMTSERNQKTFVITQTKAESEQLDKLMWHYPAGRFLPHARADDQESGKVPVIIGLLSDLYPIDVVINLCAEAVPQPERFSRILEFVPYADDEKQASRVKFTIYRDQGLKPRTSEASTPSR